MNKEVGTRKQVDELNNDLFEANCNLQEDNKILQQQLKAYKAKEDILLSDYDLLKREYIKLKQQKQDLKEWLKEEIKNADDKSNSISNLTNISYGSRSYALKETLERLG